jgi:hypothetical protein
MDKNAKMIIEEDDRTITIEDNYDDLTIREWCQMFYASMIGITFCSKTILNGMKDFVEELSEEFEKTVE